MSNQTGIVTTQPGVLTVSPATSFNHWQLARFTANELSDLSKSGNLANPEKDGISNLLKYAFAINRTAPDRTALPKPGLQNGYLKLTYARNKAATDLAYIVEVSGDLKTWHSGAGYTSSPALVSENSATQTLAVTDLTPMASTKNRFIRLRVAGTKLGVWQSAYFTPAQLAAPGISGDTAAPAGDGVPNLMKYALGMNPTINSRTGLPISGTAIVSGSNYLTFTYKKNKNTTDISYHPEWSTNLTTWSSAGITEQVLSDDGVFQQVLDSTLPSSFPRVFMRLRVTRP